MGLVVKELYNNTQLVVPSGVTHMFFEFVENPNPVKFIEATRGGETNLFLRVDGTLYTSGSGTNGILGNNTITNRSQPAMINTNVAYYRDIFEGAAGSNLDQYSFFAMTREGGFQAWGVNTSGQLGDNSLTNKSNPSSTGLPQGTTVASIYSNQGTTAFLLRDGRIAMTGLNTQGALGDNTVTNRSSPVLVAGPNRYLKTITQYQHTVAIGTDGRLLNWGRNAVNDLTVLAGASSPIQMINTKQFIDVVAVNSGDFLAPPDYCFAALTTDRTVWTWGYSSVGALGTNEVGTRRTPAQVTFPSDFIPRKIYAYDPNSFACLGEDGRLLMWGNASSFKIGDGALGGRSVPVEPLGNHRFTNFTGKSSCSVGLKEDGTLWRWGLLSGATAVSSPIQMNPSSPQRFISAKAANSYVAALNQDGKIWAFAPDNSNGQMATGNLTAINTLSELTNVGQNAWQGGTGTLTQHAFGSTHLQYCFLQPVTSGETINITLGHLSGVNGRVVQPMKNLTTGTNQEVASIFATMCRVGWLE
jgi:alpha-tubulin suppressor-like RCC1 family protein